jgi:hypothetical protein
MSNAALRANKHEARLAALKIVITIISLLAAATLVSSCASEGISSNDETRAPGEPTPAPALGARSGWTW